MTAGPNTHSSLFTTFISLLVCLSCSNKSQKNSSRGAFPAPGFVALAVDNPQPELPIVTAPSGFSDLAYYKLVVQGTTLGSAVIARSSAEPSQDIFAELKIAHRLGYAPLLSVIKFSGHTNQSILSSAQQTINVRHNESSVYQDSSEWTKNADAPLSLSKGTPLNFLAKLGLKPYSGKNQSLNSGTNIQYTSPFFDPQKFVGKNNLRVLNPLTGLPLSTAELSAKFANDGFAEEFKLPWFGGISLQFIRESSESFEKLAAQLPQMPIELAWFSDAQSLPEDIRRLQAIALTGTQFSRNSEKTIRKNLPQLPYLFHRKLFNFNKLCERVAAEISAGLSHRLSSEQLLTQIGWVIRNNLAEDHRELPRSLVNSPELEVLADDSKKWQWAKIIANMLFRTHEELSQILDIEDSQKVNVTVRVSSRSLARDSVIKGMLRSGRLVMRQQVESTSTQMLSPSSLLRLPSDFLQPLKVAMNQNSSAAALQTTAKRASPASFEFINGQSFAKGEFPQLSPLCENFQGRVGLDLGTGQNDLFSSSIVRGVWDESTRVQLVRQFSRRASANSACREVVLRTSGELANAAKSELESFRRDVLQTEMEFQISIGANRTVRLVPGTYELVLSSLVNGSILGKREIIIPQGHDNLMLNLQL